MTAAEREKRVSESDSLASNRVDSLPRACYILFVLSHAIFTRGATVLIGAQDSYLNYYPAAQPDTYTT